MTLEEIWACLDATTATWVRPVTATGGLGDHELMIWVIPELVENPEKIPGFQDF